MSTISNFIDFLKTSTNPYEAVRSIKKILLDANFEEVCEEDIWNLKKGAKYFVTRNDSSIIGFSIPTSLDDLSINFAAAHTDSPTFKVKPHNNKLVCNNYSLINTEVYGGPIYSSFFDRPLSLSGRVFVKKDNTIESKLINFNRDLLVIPNECIHFNRDVNNGKNYNPQIDLMPLLGEKKSVDDLIESEFNLKKEDVLSYDLTLYSRFRGSIYGAENEYFLAPQIDDLESAYGLFKGFVDAKNDKSINVCIAFDNEEVGSGTKQGADSTFLRDTIERIFSSLKLSEEELDSALAKSLLVSCDNAHAVHPNDVNKTDELNKVFMNKGIVVKHNANQHYTTDALSSAVFKFIMNKASIPYQDFTNRSDVRGGGTLGAISTSHVSVASVDIGLAQLAMHSCVETAGTLDLDYLINGMKSYFNSHITKECGKIKIE